MTFEERRLPGDGTLAAAFRCPQCGRVVAMLTNPMETQLVASLGVQIGGRTIPAQPLEMVRGMVAAGEAEALPPTTPARARPPGRAGPIQRLTPRPRPRRRTTPPPHRRKTRI